MQLSTDDLLVLVYNYALVLSGGYFVFQFEVDDRFFMLGVTFVFALFWTAYFRIVMVPKLFADADESADAELTDS